jgi:hypothetical protein
MKKETIISFSIVILVVVGLGLFSLTRNTKVKCPDDYANADESIEAMNQWTDDFYNSHPNASLSDWSSARKQFYINNNCNEALKRFNDYKSGNADPETTKIIDEVFQEEMSKIKE